MYRRFEQTYLVWFFPNTRLIISHLKGPGSEPGTSNQPPPSDIGYDGIRTHEVRDSSEAIVYCCLYTKLT